MRKKKVGAIAIKSFALLVVLGPAYVGTANQAMAQEAKSPYPNMAIQPRPTQQTQPFLPWTAVS